MLGAQTKKATRLNVQPFLLKQKNQPRELLAEIRGPHLRIMKHLLGVARHGDSA